MEYISIDLHITSHPSQENTYLVAATLRARRGREAIGQTSFTLPPNLMEDLEPHLMVLEARATQQQDSMSMVQSFGQQLFDSLFSGEVRNLYDERKNSAIEHNCGLRLCLRIRPLDLIVLPWEFLYDARRAEYLCLSQNPKIWLVRSTEQTNPPRPSKYTPPLRLLGMISDPKNLGLLRGPQEKAAINNALANLVKEGQVDLDWKDGSVSTLQNLKLQARRLGEKSDETWHVFHFIGHGVFEETGKNKNKQGQLAFEDASRWAQYVSADRFRMSLPSSIQLVFLNGCETARGNKSNYTSSVAHSLAEKGISAVVGMQFKVSDPGAQLFAETFYTWLATGATVDEAIAEARSTLYEAEDRTNPLDWAAPILYMSSSSGALFSKMKTPQLPPQSPPIPPITREAPPQPSPGSAPPQPSPPIPPIKRRIPPLLAALLVVLALLLMIGAGVIFAIKLNPDHTTGPSSTRIGTSALPYFRPTPGPLSCMSGNITINGSTALQPLLMLVAEDYIQQCQATKRAVGKITVQGSGSGTGLEQVENGQVEIGSSDLFVRELFQPPLMNDLVDYQVAAVIFAVVVNDQAGITNLNVDQLKKIYMGTYTNWKQVGGPDLQIVAYSRSTGSGTRVTFDRYILDGAENTKQQPISDTQEMVTAVENKPGAIGYASLFDVENAHSQHIRIISINGSQPNVNEVKGGGYLFWNIEHLYTRGPAKGLTKAFIDYMGSASAATIIENHSFVSISYLSAGLLDSHRK